MKKIFILFLFTVSGVFGQNRPLVEEDFYRIVTLPIPEGVQLEVGGLATLPDGRLGVCTRRGDVWLVSNPYMKNGTTPTYKRFATGLHEPLGLNYINGNLWATQRGELTILKDTDGNGVADDYQAFYKFPLSGNYHEYSYGPVLLPNNDMLITLNLGWIGHGASLSKWRGWMLRLTPDGKMTPWATGLRSPAGFAVLKNGDIYYTENQGDWVGSGRMTQLEEGDFAGNPEGLIWTSEPDSPLKLKASNVLDTGEPMYDIAPKVPNLKVPAIWFPHTLMGISTSDIAEDLSGGKFGPFEGQLFVGDQGHSKIMRVFLEKVKGKSQGACFPFREGFQSGILRMKWGLDNSMFVGMTSRGWSSTGKDEFGLQRLEWTGRTPFEMKTIKSMPDGFLIEFTQPVNKDIAKDIESYKANSFTYKYHHNYGSPIINAKALKIKAIQVAEDGMSVRLAIDSLRLGYIHELKLEGIRSAEDRPLLHNFGYYTLNNINDAAPAIDVKKYAVVEKKAAEEHAGHSMNNAPKTEMKASAKRVTEMPESWGGKADQTISVGTKPGLKFDIANIQVKAGAKIHIIFNNNDDMLHNFVVVKPGTVGKVGEAAFKMGLDGESKAYVPNLPEVIAHTALMQPEASESIYFVAPTAPGNYTFVCTYPGHYTVMQGTLKVVK
ncbi:plastocyanin/azurin family copper-binding protein [Emticicia sp. C21]|uniref:plastocyanin/azurin family copper-binding protein n=1 Tax=Emticicia sp. C21 TaxID=2302915 RepID=UPI000E34782D|nr:plastocyanin/azurin family copper-binding protein [Emticicia sp. C21]RFS18560.1 auracyanin family protein [Emticicia sp. C21]